MSSAARKCLACMQVYAGSALIEWHGEKNDTVPRKIFELGLQNFETEAEYVLTYADFLWGLGDYDNMRALFERALGAKSNSKKLWDRYIQVQEPLPSGNESHCSKGHMAVLNPTESDNRLRIAPL